MQALLHLEHKYFVLTRAKYDFSYSFSFVLYRPNKPVVSRVVSFVIGNQLLTAIKLKLTLAQES